MGMFLKLQLLSCLARVGNTDHDVRPVEIRGNIRLRGTLYSGNNGSREHRHASVIVSCLVQTTLKKRYYTFLFSFPYSFLCSCGAPLMISPHFSPSLPPSLSPGILPQWGGQEQEACWAAWRGGCVGRCSAAGGRSRGTVPRKIISKRDTLALLPSWVSSKLQTIIYDTELFLLPATY